MKSKTKILIPLLIVAVLISVISVVFITQPNNAISYEHSSTIKEEKNYTQPIEIENANNGTISVHSITDKTAKALVIKDGNDEYRYPLPEDGSYIEIPLNQGNGTYTVHIMEKVDNTDRGYVSIAEETFTVNIPENVPYLTTNLFCDYAPTSSYVELANTLCENKSDKEKVNVVADWVASNISYDSEKASNLKDSFNYTPNNDETFNTQKGICIDYSSLTAAMLRSQGIPTKVLTGYCKGQYHSWNEVLVDGEWVTLDVTGASTAHNSPYRDAANYTVKYIY